MKHVSFLESPIGWLRILSNGNGIAEIKYVDFDGPEDPDVHTESAKTQLKEYFEGQRSVFNLELFPEGTAFEQKVWNQLLKIPEGKTVTYGEIARLIENGKGAQAVGKANGNNPIAIIIPCHRVIGADQSLTGYGGGIKRKEWLLKHEGALLL